MPLTDSALKAYSRYESEQVVVEHEFFFFVQLLLI